MSKLCSLAEAVEGLSGSRVGIGGRLHSRKPIAFVDALIEAGARDLDVVVSHGSLDVDLLADAGALRSVSRAYVGFDRFGEAPFYSGRVKDGGLRSLELSEFQLVFGLRASEMGVSFLPSKALMGSDLTRVHNLEQVSCPYTGERFTALPAIRVDVAVIHANAADENGTVIWPEWPERGHDLDEMLSHSASRVIVTVEQVVSRNYVREHSRLTRLFPFEVTHIVHAPRGAWPTACAPFYGPDFRVLNAYVQQGRAATDSEAFVTAFLNDRRRTVERQLKPTTEVAAVEQ